MDTVPYLRTQTELLADIEALQRDTSNNRWSEVEIYRAINQALMTWHEKVKLPRVYTISGGFTASDYDYDLPAYMREPIFPQILRRKPYYEYATESATSTWQDVPGYDTEPNSTGGLTLRLSSPPRTLEARILWYAPNSRVPFSNAAPSVPPVTTGSTAADATTVVISTVIDVDDVSTIKIDSEYMQYSGVTRGTSTTTLLNIVHALNGSAAAVHNSGTTVNWCVGADDMRLYPQLYNQARAYLNALPLTDGGVHETSRYERLMGYYQQISDGFWPTYKPIRKRSNVTLNSKSFARR